MKCLNIKQIYLYIEKELEAAENKKIEEHLASCLKCRNAFEERKLLVQAAESLPLWETPPQFTQQVMARIFPLKVSPFAWLRVLAAAFTSISLALLILFLATGQNLSTLIFSLNHTFWSYVRDFLPISVKLLKLASLLLKVVQQLSGYLLKALSWLTTLVSPQLQLIMAMVTIILIALFIYGIKRKILIGEKA